MEAFRWQTFFVGDKMIITQEFGLYGGIFLIIAYLALARALNLYRRVKYMDKIIHLFSGIVIAMFLLDNGFSLLTIISVNVIIAIAWEIFQIKVKERVGFKKVGFPDGYWDILYHMIGTIGYLIFLNL